MQEESITIINAYITLQEYLAMLCMHTTLLAANQQQLLGMHCKWFTQVHRSKFHVKATYLPKHMQLFNP